ncbi:hypothetical protein BaRGS_00003587 [Batillaria attramentaria]|uniref:Uncharacterized protein n=1 Tax=Batillaria attramentaria TaxID=370345 RepID=A0ABD0M1B3_9CAEN
MFLLFLLAVKKPVLTSVPDDRRVSQTNASSGRKETKTNKHKYGSINSNKNKNTIRKKVLGYTNAYFQILLISSLHWGPPRTSSEPTDVGKRMLVDRRKETKVCSTPEHLLGLTNDGKTD